MAQNRGRGHQGQSRGQGTMSRSEAGRLGGLAAHSCRGKECHQAQRRDRSASSSNERGRSSSGHSSEKE